MTIIRDHLVLFDRPIIDQDAAFAQLNDELAGDFDLTLLGSITTDARIILTCLVPFMGDLRRALQYRYDDEAVDGFFRIVAVHPEHWGRMQPLELAA